MDRQWPAKNDPRRYNFEEAVGANHTVRMDTPCRCGFTSVCAHSCVDVGRCAAHVPRVAHLPWAHVRSQDASIAY